MLHTHDSGEAFAVDVLEDVAVVDLARPRLVTTGVVAHLEVRDLIPGRIDVGDQVPLGDLLVIDVEQDLAGGAVHGLADQIRLRA